MSNSKYLIGAIYGYLAGCLLIAGLFFYFVSDHLAHWHFMKRCANGPVSRMTCELIWQVEIEEPPDPCPESNPVFADGVLVGCTDDKTNFRGTFL